MSQRSLGALTIAVGLLVSSLVGYEIQLATSANQVPQIASAAAVKVGRVTSFKPKKGYPVAIIKDKKYKTVKEVEKAGFIVQRHHNGKLYVDEKDCDVNVSYEGSTGADYDDGYTDGWNLRNQETEKHGEDWPRLADMPSGSADYEKGWSTGYADHPFMDTQESCRIYEVLDPKIHDPDGWYKKDDSLVTVSLPSDGSSFEKTVKKDDVEGKIIEYQLMTKAFGREGVGNVNKITYTSGDELKEMTVEQYLEAILAGAKTQGEAKSTDEKVVTYEAGKKLSVKLKKGNAAGQAFKFIETNLVGASIGQVTETVISSTMMYAVKTNPTTIILYEFTLETPDRQGETHNEKNIEKFVKEKVKWKK